MPAASIVRLRGAAGEIADGGDFAIADANVAGIPRRAGAIDDVAVGDDEVERAGRLRGHWRGCNEKQPDRKQEIQFVKLHRFSFLHRYLRRLKPAIKERSLSQR